jgi:hypothetical protein
MKNGLKAPLNFLLMIQMLFTDQSNGYEQVEKLCADEERPGKLFLLSYY